MKQYKKNVYCRSRTNYVIINFRSYIRKTWTRHKCAIHTLINILLGIKIVCVFFSLRCLLCVWCVYYCGMSVFVLSCINNKKLQVNYVLIITLIQAYLCPMGIIVYLLEFTFYGVLSHKEKYVVVGEFMYLSGVQMWEVREQHRRCVNINRKRVKNSEFMSRAKPILNEVHAIYGMSYRNLAPWGIPKQAHHREHLPIVFLLTNK